MSDATPLIPDDALTDDMLVASALEGDRRALDALIARYQGWVFNLAIRMLWNREDAADCAQEILIKVVTHLSGFQRRSAFRTWLFRISANHLMEWKRKSRAEQAIGSFDCYGKCLSALPDVDIVTASPEHALLLEEAKIGCMTGMLLCLTREQRLVYVLGEIFEMGDRVGAAVLEISPESYRQRLCRARGDLHAFLLGNCGLANPKNPCRCARKTAEFIRTGIVDPANLQFSPHATKRVEEVVRRGRRFFDGMVAEGLGQLYRHHPFLNSPDMVHRLRALISDRRFRELLDLAPAALSPAR